MIRVIRRKLEKLRCPFVHIFHIFEGCSRILKEKSITSLPQDWPDVISINPDIVITISNVGETEGKYVASVDGTYSGEADDIYNYYKQEFSSLDIDEYVQKWENGSVKNTIQTSKDGYDIAVSVTKSERGVDVSLWVKKQ